MYYKASLGNPFTCSQDSPPSFIYLGNLHPWGSYEGWSILPAWQRGGSQPVGLGKTFV